MQHLANLWFDENIRGVLILACVFWAILANLRRDPLQHWHPTPIAPDETKRGLCTCDGPGAEGYHSFQCAVHDALCICRRAREARGGKWELSSPLEPIEELSDHGE